VSDGLWVQNMVQRLSAFDPLEVEILYVDATDAERRVIEAAVDAIGRQPRRVANPAGDQVVWEHLLDPERVAAGRESRLEQANPDGATALRDLEHMRSTYDALASAAAGLLRDSLPTHTVAAPYGVAARPYPPVACPAALYSALLRPVACGPPMACCCARWPAALPPCRAALWPVDVARPPTAAGRRSSGSVVKTPPPQERDGETWRGGFRRM
jgi:hypothetical protein